MPLLPEHAHTPGINARPAPHVPVQATVDAAFLNVHPDYLAGWFLLRSGYPWEAHEVWEDIWRKLPASSGERHFVQGLIRLAAAAVKGRQRNRAGILHHLAGAKAHFDAAGNMPSGGIAPQALNDWIETLSIEMWLSAGPDAPGPLIEIGPG